MKKTVILFSLALGLNSGLSAQKLETLEIGDVPKPVLDAFAKQYAGAQAKTYYPEGSDIEIFYTLNGKKSESIYRNDGTWIETETWIKVSDLPEAVRENIESGDLGDWKIVNIEKVTLPDDNPFYEIDLKKDEKESQVYYDEAGTKLEDDRWLDEDEDDFAEADSEDNND